MGPSWYYARRPRPVARAATGLLAAVAPFLTAAGAPAAQPAAPQIHVVSCKVLVAGHGDLDATATRIDVRFEVRSLPLREITWRAATPAGTVNVTAFGTFSPGVSIYRGIERRGRDYGKFPRFASLETMGPGTCSVVRTVAADGTTWNAQDASSQTLRVPDVPGPRATPVPASLDNPLRDPVGIVSCQFTMEATRAFGYVRFRNLAATTIDRVTFRAFFGSGAVDFELNGRFSPGVTVRAADLTRHDLPPNAFQEYLTLDAPTSCVAVAAHYVDGDQWLNSSVSAAPPPFPVIPDGYDAITANER